MHALSPLAPWWRLLLHEISYPLSPSAAHWPACYTAELSSGVFSRSCCQADARTLEHLAELQDPQRRRSAAAQVRQAGDFAEVSDLLRQLMAAADGLRQLAPPMPGPESASEALAATGLPASSASASTTLVWEDAAEGSTAVARWPDAVAAAAAAPCAAAYWARSMHSELGVQHWAQRLRSVATRAAAAQQELLRRGVQPAGTEAPGAQAGPVQAQTDAQGSAPQQLAAGAAGPAEPAAAEPAGAVSHAGSEAEMEEGDVDSVASLSDEQLELLLGLALEEGALALAHAHSPLAGERPPTLGVAGLNRGWLWMPGGKHAHARQLQGCISRLTTRPAGPPPLGGVPSGVW